MTKLEYCYISGFAVFLLLSSPSYYGIHLISVAHNLACPLAVPDHVRFNHKIRGASGVPVDPSTVKSSILEYTLSL